MTEPTPTLPPDRPLPEEARARIRAELLAQRPGSRSWAVPLAAAAAVALVAGAAWWSVGLGGDDQGPEPAVSTPTTVPVAPTSTVVAPHPTETASQVGTGSCRTELRNVLRGAEEVFGAEPFSYWVRGEQYSVCYEADGTTTVTQPLPLAPQAQRVDAYRVASTYPPTATGFSAVRVAGGPVPAGADPFDVAYTFPDGHTEHAVLGTDARGRWWWRMVYAYDPGPGNETKGPPIEVDVTAGSFSYSFALAWATDTCAQANHGC
ncbi:hypothetical protein G5V58_07595 [Nocardioides anomalus]|uniref:Uncharacterized protein n=1 Tax=Nocardioides anomalus TaxID=2712223 RepID=A0A6G6WC91_9ACTN|nr:hypothetical protein [Nocardioides anomalus]QIG42660.1 hypothetical protein G5V58_07595 [Nocardioides anomalus]